MWLHQQKLNKPGCKNLKNHSLPLSLPKIKKMEVNQSRTKYWVLCFLWLAIMVTLLVVYRQFFWLALPGTVTYFAKALDLI